MEFSLIQAVLDLVKEAAVEVVGLALALLEALDRHDGTIQNLILILKAFLQVFILLLEYEVLLQLLVRYIRIVHGGWRFALRSVLWRRLARVAPRVVLALGGVAVVQLVSLRHRGRVTEVLRDVPHLREGVRCSVHLNFYQVDAVSRVHFSQVLVDARHELKALV